MRMPAPDTRMSGKVFFFSLSTLYLGRGKKKEEAFESYFLLTKKTAKKTTNIFMIGVGFRFMLIAEYMKMPSSCQCPVP